MPISERSSKLIWGQCAARCCICKIDLVYAPNAGATSLLGEVAHIVGETRAAARGDSSMTRAERNCPDNLLLLCRPHHKIIDDDPVTHPIQALHKIKADHILWVASKLVQPHPWRSPLSQLTYINVPRLCEQAELQGYDVDLSRYKQSQTLHSLGWDLNHVMSSFQNVLAYLQLNAVNIEDIVVHESFIGTAVSFNRHRFRTKNVPCVTRDADPVSFPFSGSLKDDPHIYTKIGDAKIVMSIDPKWITTSTATTLFRPPSGQSIFSGIGLITAVDYDALTVSVTPWVIGLPKSILEFSAESFEQKRVESTRSLDNEDSPLDNLVDAKRAQVAPCYFSPPPSHCDLCRHTLKNDKYMIDGGVRDAGFWACMCESCFLSRGRKIGWGHGQLYIQDKNRWLLVAGFPPP
ncbi:MAG: HNH endonuclease [Xanthomonadales bacterium]|nr:HNH endonuclease [Xanthomonadales bacterium]